MPKYLTAAVLTLLSTGFLAAVQAENAPVSEGKPGRVLRHVVLFKFKDAASKEAVKKVEDAFRALPAKIPEIKDFEWGTDVSVENKAAGFTHGFLVTFASIEDRDKYLPHPAHKEFGGIVGPTLDKVLVFDFWAGK